MMLYFSEQFLTIIITLAVFVTGVAAVSLLAMYFKDRSKGQLW